MVALSTNWKMKMFRKAQVVFMCLIVSGCAAFQRSCAVFNAEQFASDWIVIQYQYNGEPINCWKLQDVSVVNKNSSDGIYWLDPKAGHLVHISGWYNRVQVNDGDFEGAARLLSIDGSKCGVGTYPRPL